jgi:hypothetical protein
MGFDKLLSFFTKNLQNNIVEDLYNKPIVVANHIYFDMNFMIYNSIATIENDINTIYQLIFGLPYTDINIINLKLTTIMNSFYWKKTMKSEIFIMTNIDKTLEQFKLLVDKHIYDLLYWNVFHSINSSIIHNHPLQFIISINLFFDGIPTYAKIVEQRRRRMKNYVDSKNRKKMFTQYFNEIIPTIITENDITFEYFEWLKYLYTFDKSLGPHSPILIKLGDFIVDKLKEEYSMIHIYLNNSTENGEADYKIFKHIKDNSIDCDVVIHSCDSDFIFMIIWYQFQCYINSVEINLMMINYNKIYNKTNYEINNTLISGKKINNLLLDKYNTINSMNSNNININVIADLLFLLLMFGNDIIPPNYELGTELNLKILFETHYSLYYNNNFVINLNKKDNNIINFTNLSKWLKLIKLSNSFSIIILNRFYKLPYNLIINIAKKYNIDEMIDNVIIPFHIKQYKEADDVDPMDFRSTLPNNSIDPNIDIMLQNNDFSNYINILNKDDYGLIKLEHTFEISNNPYQALYNYIILNASNKTEDEFNRPYKIFFNNIREAETSYTLLTKNCNTLEYLELLIYTSQMLFYDFDLYTPYSLFSYSDLIAPSIDMIINFISTNNMNNIQSSCYKTCFNKTPYFDLISHHLFITPYLLESSYIDSIDIKHIESLLNIINYTIPGIWYKDGEPFILKKIDPLIFIELYTKMIQLYQNNFINNFFKNSFNLLN